MNDVLTCYFILRRVTPMYHCVHLDLLPLVTRTLVARVGHTSLIKARELNIKNKLF